VPQGEILVSVLSRPSGARLPLTGSPGGILVSVPGSGLVRVPIKLTGARQSGHRSRDWPHARPALPLRKLRRRSEVYGSGRMANAHFRSVLNQGCVAGLENPRAWPSGTGCPRMPGRQCQTADGLAGLPQQPPLDSVGCVTNAITCTAGLVTLARHRPRSGEPSGEGQPQRFCTLRSGLCVREIY
jgi:hypothetical protein